MNQGVLQASFLCRRVLDHNIEHLAKVLAQTVARSCLDAATCNGNKALNRRRILRTRELLINSFLAFDDRDSKKMFVHISIIIQYL
jgi:hypothetical protein